MRNLHLCLVEYAAFPLTHVHPGQLCPVKGADLPQLPDFSQGVPSLHPVVKPSLRIMPSSFTEAHGGYSACYPSRLQRTKQQGSSMHADMRCLPAQRWK